MSTTSMGVTAYTTLARSRIESGLTQRDVAEAIGISTPQFNRVENGHKTVTSDQLFAWAAAVGCEVTVTRKAPL